METFGFFNIFLVGVVVVALSFILDHVWAAAIPVRTLYYIIRLPGVILHECAHMAGCLLTGARIQNVVFFSREGGSVMYTRPLIPYLGDVIISTAPLFVIPLVLSGITWFFITFLGCIFPVFPQTIVSMDALITLGEGIVGTFHNNLVSSFNGWFLMYLYLTISLVLSAAPSGQDMKNASIGIFLLTLAGIMIVWSKIPIAISLLDEFMRLLEIGFTLGFVYGLIALLISLPVILWYVYTRTR
ncbi:MAG: hypothetical protein M0Q92_09500 [Methanoregula sp.]|jgi:hypothetical protein|nr:hypothetical protein [Methanoregula sp.]